MPRPVMVEIYKVPNCKVSTKMEVNDGLNYKDLKVAQYLPKECI